MYDTCPFFLHLLCACHFPLSSPVLAPLRSFHLGFFRPTPSFVSIPLYSYDTSRPSTCSGTTCTAHTYTASRIRDSPARSLLNFLEPAGPARQFRRRLLHHLTMHARFAASAPPLSLSFVHFVPLAHYIYASPLLLCSRGRTRGCTQRHTFTRLERLIYGHVNTEHPPGTMTMSAAAVRPEAGTDLY